MENFFILLVSLLLHMRYREEEALEPPISTFDKLTHELLMIDDKNLTKAPDILASKSIRFAHGSLPIHA